MSDVTFDASRGRHTSFAGAGRLAPVIFCYFCGTEQPVAARTFCVSCRRSLILPPALANLGRAYLLNRLPDLVGGDLLDETAATRVRAAIAVELAGRPLPAAAPSVEPWVIQTRAQPPTRTPPALPRSPGESFFTPERAPSLLLYLGAFLIVIAALIFVNVSGQQISDPLRLWLMVFGTIGFTIAGLVCARSTLVAEAGRTFVAIGALLVPLDVLAYYALVVRAAPLTTPAMWVLGSLIAAGLYAALTVTGYGRAYGYLFFGAVLSVLTGSEALVHLRGAWLGVPFVAFALVVEVADRIPVDPRVARLTSALVFPGRALALSSLALGAVAVIGLSRDYVDRAAMPALALLGFSYYAARAARGPAVGRIGALERWLAAAGPAGVALALVFVADAPPRTYGIALALIAVAYAVATETQRPVPIDRDRTRVLAYAAAAGALLPVDDYWRGGSLLGAAAYLCVAVLLGVLAQREAARSGVSDPGPLVFVGVASAHVGVLLLLVGLGVLRAGTATFSGLVVRDVALALSPVALVVGLLATGAPRWARRLTPSLSVSAIASAAVVVDLSLGEPGLCTALAALAAVGVVVGGVATGRARSLWVAAGFAAISAMSLFRWLEPPVELTPLALGAGAVALFVPAYLRGARRSDFARIAREIAIVTSAAGVFIGVWFAQGEPRSAWETSVWLATAPILSVFGALSVAEGLRRRSERIVVGATATFLGSILMVVAHAHPSAVEAYSVPTAAYLGLVAWGVTRFGSRALAPRIGVPAQLAAAVALIVPTYAWSFEGNELARTVAVLAASLVLLTLARGRGLHELGAAAVGGLVLGVVRACIDPTGLEIVAAAFGIATLALLGAASRWRTPRADDLVHDAAEAAAVLLVLAPSLVRAASGGPDALGHGVAVLVAGTVIVAVSLLTGRRALAVSAGVVLALVAVLATREPEKAEPYVLAAGAALVLLLAAIPTLLPRRLSPPLERALEALAGWLVLTSTIARLVTVRGDAMVDAWIALASAIALLGAGLALRRAGLYASGLVGTTVLGLWIASDPTAREMHGIVAGAALIAMTLAAIRYAPRTIAERALAVTELLGALLFVGPTLFASWRAPFIPGTVLVFVEVFVLLGVGVLFRRRRIAAVALAAIGLEGVRGAIDVVNRLPNWALFGGSGALLLAAGFLLLIKREAWNAWSRSAYQWWARL